MSDEYPLYPELPEEAQKEAIALIECFKEKLANAAEEAIGSLYCDVMGYIESDTWSNFRNQILDGMRNYPNKKIQGEYDFKQIRQAILKEHREMIIDDLNQDMVEEIESLKKTIESLQDFNRRSI